MAEIFSPKSFLHKFLEEAGNPRWAILILLIVTILSAVAQASYMFRLFPVSLWPSIPMWIFVAVYTVLIFSIAAWTFLSVVALVRSSRRP